MYGVRTPPRPCPSLSVAITSCGVPGFVKRIRAARGAGIPFISPEPVVDFITVGTAYGQCAADDLALSCHFDDRHAGILDHLPGIIRCGSLLALVETSHVEACLYKVAVVDGFTVFQAYM